MNCDVNFSNALNFEERVKRKLKCISKYVFAWYWKNLIKQNSIAYSHPFFIIIIIQMTGDFSTMKSITSHPKCYIPVTEDY